MVLIRNNVQKESTYGWYPSQVNVYENPRAKHGYDKECLFRHWESQLHYTNPNGVKSVTPPTCKASLRSTLGLEVPKRLYPRLRYQSCC
ncbi:hypothetical protein EB796_006477 [Bugula neritina]|uniref:Uncharacterized protein n=1 Tax=Bugula neritina TaxID=10212 RepID=A0A7J7KBK5_BUGNE|nr:hypothetical protein EB796_006477 [Bugula neritina]